MKVVNVKPLKENVTNVPKEKKEEVKKPTVLTHKQKQYLRTKKYKEQLRRTRVNQPSRNCYNCHNTCCFMPSNFQGNHIAHSQGKRTTKVQIPKQAVPIPDVPKQDVPKQMKPHVPKPQKEPIFKYSNQEILKISDFKEQKKMFTSLWVQSNMIFPQPKSKFEKSKQVWIPKNI